MALSKESGAQLIGLQTVANGQQQVTPGHVRNPQQSDIRELGTDDLEATKAFELIGNQQRHDVLFPPPLDFDAAIDQYAKLNQKDTEASHALRVGDLPQAIAALLRENIQLRQEVESSRADFEELRSVNLAIQEQADAALQTADDQRIELLDELDRTRGTLMELENQLDDALAHSRELSGTDPTAKLPTT
jgi:hypothetical protein